METYKRGQAEWALWQAFRPSGRVDAPPVFRSRVKRLLDLDRIPDPHAAGLLAFSEKPMGSGSDAAYTSFDVFCIGIGLELLDGGIRQGDVVFLMRHIRADLEPWFPDLVARPSRTDRQAKRAKDHPNYPSYKTEDGSVVADLTVFMLLYRIELTEGLIGVPENMPAFGEPVFCEGVKELQDIIADRMPLHRRSYIVVEIAWLAQRLTELLAVAPVTRRGRQAGT